MFVVARFSAAAPFFLPLHFLRSWNASTCGRSGCILSAVCPGSAVPGRTQDEQCKHDTHVHIHRVSPAWAGSTVIMPRIAFSNSQLSTFYASGRRLWRENRFPSKNFSSPACAYTVITPLSPRWRWEQINQWGMQILGPRCRIRKYAIREPVGFALYSMAYCFLMAVMDGWPFRLMQCCNNFFFQNF